MPFVTFECEDGSIHEIMVENGLDHPEGEISEFVDDEGVKRKGVRLVGAFHGGINTKGVSCISTQTRKWDPDVKKHDPQGRAIFEGRRDYEDFVARKRDKGENWFIE